MLELVRKLILTICLLLVVPQVWTPICCLVYQIYLYLFFYFSFITITLRPTNNRNRQLSSACASKQSNQQEFVCLVFDAKVWRSKGVESSVIRLETTIIIPSVMLIIIVKLLQCFVNTLYPHCWYSSFSRILPLVLLLLLLLLLLFLRGIFIIIVNTVIVFIDYFSRMRRIFFARYENEEIENSTTRWRLTMYLYIYVLFIDK